MTVLWFKQECSIPNVYGKKIYIYENWNKIVTLRGLIFAKIYFREFREFCLNSRKYVFAKYLNVTNLRKFVFAKYLNNTNSRKFSFAKYSKNCRFAKINPRFFPEEKLSLIFGVFHSFIKIIKIASHSTLIFSILMIMITIRSKSIILAKSSNSQK